MNAALITISDTRTEATDTSGHVLEDLINKAGGTIIDRRIISDDRELIAETLVGLAANPGIDLILTAGGTGVSPRDITPEATRDVIDFEIPGISETIRRESYDKVKTSMLSRGTAGVLNGTLIINLPGSPKAVEECFAVVQPILRHTLNQIRGIADH